MKIKLMYTSGPNDSGSAYSYEHEAEVRDDGEALETGREFARLCYKLGLGCNEGFNVTIPDRTEGDDDL